MDYELYGLCRAVEAGGADVGFDGVEAGSYGVAPGVGEIPYVGEGRIVDADNRAALGVLDHEVAFHGVGDVAVKIDRGGFAYGIFLDREGCLKGLGDDGEIDCRARRLSGCVADAESY